MAQILNHRIARLRVLKAIREGHNSDEAVEQRFMPENSIHAGTSKPALRKQLNQILTELEDEGAIERELSHGLWVVKAAGYRKGGEQD